MIEQISWPTIVWSSCIKAVSSEGAWNVKKELLETEISKGIFKIKDFFPNSKLAVISGSDEKELLDPQNPERKKVEDEISDIITYAIRLCDVMNIDLESVMKRKFKENEMKYPADQVRGSARKYDDY